MNVSFSITAPTITPPQVDTNNQTQQTTTQTDKSLTISITSGTGGGSPVSPTAITLSFPLIGPEDIALNEVMQELQNLDLGALKTTNLTAAVLLLNQQAGDLGAALTRGGPDYVKQNAPALTETFTKMEEQAKKAETQLFDMLNSSTYPDFKQFLGKMLIAAQELRELASKAKHSLVMAEYGNVLDQAKQMEIAAQKNYESTMKEIDASRTEAIGKIISGALTIATTAAGGILGGRDKGVGVLGGAQLGSGIGGAFGQIIDGSTGLAAGKTREDAAALKLEADMAGAVQKKFEATQKLLQESESITDELMNISKTLSDMVLKLYQDFLSNQSQIVQRSNI